MNRSNFMIISLLLTVLSSVYSCQQPCILLTNSTNILAVSASSNLTPNKLPTSVISNLKRSVALDVHVVQKQIFWSDTIEKNIKRANLDGSSITTIVEKNTGVIVGLAVEWNANLLYWTDSTFKKIEVARLDGSRRMVLIEDKTINPRGIALDPQAGLMFWTNHGDSSPKIQSAYLNGGNPLTIIANSLRLPDDIALDYSSRKIYWTDALIDKIAYADYNGLNRGDLELLQGTTKFGLEIYNSWLYWSGLELNQINKSSGVLIGQTKIYGRGMGLAIMDRSRQPSISNPCLTNNGGCSHLCLLKPNGFTCQCGDGMILDSDGKTCRIKDFQPPIFTSCPANKLQYADKYIKTASVTWSTPQATDNSGKAPKISLSSSRLPEGVYNVSYTAVDQANNEAYCKFTITIKVIRCAVPSTSGALQRQSCQNHYGGTCRFTCLSGYYMHGSSTLNCQATGEWDNSVPRCEQITVGCFPASAKLTLNTGDVITMRNLKIGDEVQTIDAKTNEFIYTEVITFLHKDSSQEMFQDIKREDGGRLVISHKHLVYSGKTRETMVMKFADEVKTGDFILANGTEIRVTAVMTVNDSGMYAPMTRDGTMLVNGVYVSCYAHWSSHEVSHLVMAPVRLWFDLSKVAPYVANFVGLSWLTNKEGSGDEMFEGLHVYADVLMKLVHYLPKGISDMYYT